MVQAAEQLATTESERYLLIYMITVLVIITALVILFFVVFQKRKNKLLLDKIRREREFEETLIRSQTEIQEQTLKNVGQELHDNVGQLLSVANMQLNLVESLVQDTLKSKLDDTKEVISDAINEVRGLSKILNSDVILNFGLEKSVQNEIDRLNRLNLISAEFKVEGNSKVIPDNDAIILFRIVQEFISNTLKYADAKNLEIHLKYQQDKLCITVKDDGIGFDLSTAEKGSGLINMESRAKLMDAKFYLNSSKDEGTMLEIEYQWGRGNAKKSI